MINIPEEEEKHPEEYIKIDCDCERGLRVDPGILEGYKCKCEIIHSKMKEALAKMDNVEVVDLFIKKVK